VKDLSPARPVLKSIAYFTEALEFTFHEVIQFNNTFLDSR